MKFLQYLIPVNTIQIKGLSKPVKKRMLDQVCAVEALHSQFIMSGKIKKKTTNTPIATSITPDQQQKATSNATRF